MAQTYILIDGFYHAIIRCVQCQTNVGHVVPCALLVCGKHNYDDHCGEFAYLLVLRSVTIRDYVALSHITLSQDHLIFINEYFKEVILISGSQPNS